MLADGRLVIPAQNVGDVDLTHLRSVTLLSNGPAELPGDAGDRLAAAGVEIDERPIAELRGAGRELSAIGFGDGSERACGGLLVPVTLAWLWCAIQSRAA